MNNKKVTIIISVLSAILMIVAVTIMSFQFVQINKLQDRLDVLQEQLDDANSKLEKININYSIE